MNRFKCNICLRYTDTYVRGNAEFGDNLSGKHTKIPSIPLTGHNKLISALIMNSMYGKFGAYHGGRVIYADTDGVFVTDIRSAYPKVLT